MQGSAANGRSAAAPVDLQRLRENSSRPRLCMAMIRPRQAGSGDGILPPRSGGPRSAGPAGSASGRCRGCGRLLRWSSRKGNRSSKPPSRAKNRAASSSPWSPLMVCSRLSGPALPDSGSRGGSVGPAVSRRKWPATGTPPGRLLSRARRAAPAQVQVSRRESAWRKSSMGARVSRRLRSSAPPAARGRARAPAAAAWRWHPEEPPSATATPADRAGPRAGRATRPRPGSGQSPTARSSPPNRSPASWSQPAQQGATVMKSRSVRSRPVHSIAQFRPSCGRFFVQHQHPVGQADLGCIVGDEQHRLATYWPARRPSSSCLLAGVQVEGEARQDARRAHQHPGQRHPLLLPPDKAAAGSRRRLQARPGRGAGLPRAGSPPCAQAGAAQAEADVFRARSAREERILLEDHAVGSRAGDRRRAGSGRVQQGESRRRCSGRSTCRAAAAADQAKTISPWSTCRRGRRAPARIVPAAAEPMAEPTSSSTRGRLPSGVHRVHALLEQSRSKPTWQPVAESADEQARRMPTRIARCRSWPSMRASMITSAEAVRAAPVSSPSTR